MPTKRKTDLDYTFPYHRINKFVDSVIEERIHKVQDQLIYALKETLTREIWGILESLADKFEYDLSKIEKVNNKQQTKRKA